MLNTYTFAGSDTIPSPALIYYREQIYENTRKAIEMAGGPDRLWPHVKTHKMASVLKISMELGIHRYKCATIAEAEMTAACGAAHIVLSYPLIGPNAQRFFNLVQAYPETHFYAIGDDIGALTQLGKIFAKAAGQAEVLIDVNMGMNRTGVELHHLDTFCQEAACIPGIHLRGFHCYDGHRTEPDSEIRMQEAAKVNEVLFRHIQTLRDQYSSMDITIIGGSPSFPCHRDIEGTYLSPGTVFIYDYGYAKKYKDLPFAPAAAIFTRVVSCPAPGYFSIDTGYKSIAADPEGLRGQLLGVEHCEPAFHSEEHWTYRMLPGYEDACPTVGDELFVIPTHICPTTALYDTVIVVEHGAVCDTWEVTARNRKITY